MNDINANDLLPDDISIRLKIAINSIALLTISDIPPDEKDLYNSIKDTRPFFSIINSSEEIKNIKSDLGESCSGRLDAVLAVIDALIRPKKISWTKVLIKVESNWPAWGTPWLIAGKDAIDWGRLDLAMDRLKMAHANLPVGHYGLMSALGYLRKKAHKSKKYDLELLSNQLLTKCRPDSTNVSHWAESALKLKDWYSFDKAIKYFFVGTNHEMFETRLDFLTKIIHSQNSTDSVIKNCLGLNFNESLEELRYDQLSSLGNILCFVNIWAARHHKLKHDYRAWADACNKIYFYSLRAISRDNPKYPEKYLLPRIGDNYAQTLRFLSLRNSEDANCIREYGEKIINYMGFKYKDFSYTAQRQLAAIYTGEAKRAIDIRLPSSDLNVIIKRADHAYESWYKYSYPDKRQFVAKAHFKFRILVKYFDGITEISMKAGYRFPEILQQILQFGLNIEDKSIASLDLNDFSNEAILLLVDKIKIEYENLKNIEVNTYGYKVHIESKKSTMARNIIDKLKKFTGLVADACNKEIKNNNLIRARNVFEALKIIKSTEYNVYDFRIELTLILAEYRQHLCTKKDLAAFIERALLHEAWSKDKSLLIDIIEIINNTSLLSDLSINNIDNLVVIFLNDQNKELLNDSINILISFSILMIKQSRTNDFLKFINDIIFKHTNQDSLFVFLKNLIIKLPFDMLISNALINLLREKNNVFLQDNEQVILITNSLVRGVIISWDKPFVCRKRLMKLINWISKNLSGSQKTLAWTQLFGSERNSIIKISIKQRKKEIRWLRKMLHQKLNKIDWINNLDKFLKIKIESNRYNLINSDKEDIKAMFDYAVCSMMNFDPINRDKEYWSNMTEYVKKITIDTAINNKAIAVIWINLQNNLIKSSLIRFSAAGNYALHSLKNIIKNYPEDTIHSIDIINNFQRTMKDTFDYLNWQYWPVLESGINLQYLIEEIAYQPPFTLGYNNERNVPMLYQIRPIKPILVRGNILMLKAMFKTLLTNSIEHTAPAPKNGWIKLELSIEQSSAHITITDNGEGINLDILRELNNVNGDFRTTKIMGTGYGIRFSQKCIQLHRGRMQVTSEGLGTGTCINIWLPLENMVVD